METILFTGKRNPPVWLIVLTGLATIIVLIGGILLLIFLRGSYEPVDVTETGLGVIALLLMILSPTVMVARYYLRLENPISIPRANIAMIESDGNRLTLRVTLKGTRRPTTFILETRSPEEANSIVSNINVRTNGRLRVYPVTFLPEQGAAKTK